MTNMLSNILATKNLKLFLIAFGFLFLYLISGTIISCVFITSIYLTVLLCLYLLNKIESKKTLKFFSNYSVPLAFLLLIILNFSGQINTLTGINEEKQTVVIYLAMPFYLLSAFSYISDCADQRNRNLQFNINAFDLLLYIVLPFKLLSGPIENPSLMKKFDSIKIITTSHRLFSSLSWIVLGAFMKFVIGNRLAPAQMISFDNPLMSFLCATIFELKFYFDFAGYSFLAYGFASLFNIQISKNFNHPFTSHNVVKFWQNWHITLGKFLQKYILHKFIFGIKSRNFKAIFACFIFVVSALWHGITFNYLLWGLFHGIIYYMYVQYIKHLSIPKFIGFSSMFLFFVFGRFLAIDANGSRLLGKISNFFDFNSYTDFNQSEIDFASNFFNIGNWGFIFAIMLAIIFIFFEFIQKNNNKNKYSYFRKPYVVIILFLMFVGFGLNTGELLYARI